MDGGPEKVWREGIGPVFQAVWPKEQRFKRPALTRALAALCAGSGDAFSDAFDVLRHYIGPLDAEWVSIHFLKSSQVPEQYPELCLELLWIICGPSSRGESTDLGDVLDRIVRTMPGLEVDRRLQWLEHRAFRLI
jgi:hypothetical protein